MIDQDLKDLLADLIKSQSELAEAQKVTDRQFKRTDKRLDQLGQQIAGLGEKFGSFTEGLAWPSLQKILFEQFQMDFSVQNMKAKINGKSMEIDAFAYSNRIKDKVYVVEVKSKLRNDGIKQIERTLKTFHDFFPHYKDSKVYGLLAVVDAPDELIKKALKRGIYVARIHDDEFMLDVPDNFEPKAYHSKK